MKSDTEISSEAVEYIKSHKQELLNKFCSGYLPQSKPVSIFMAGSPGAGKTEFSKALIELIPEYKSSIVRIDPDEIRLWLPQYIPGKAELFQEAVSSGVSKLHDYVKSKSISFLLDGTFANLARARQNVQMSLDKNYAVKIQYVFQPPEIAWQFTQEREKVEGRNIKRESFISQYLNSRETVAIIKEEFGNLIEVDLIERDVIKNTNNILFNVDNVDRYLSKKYSKSDLESLI